MSTEAKFVTSNLTTAIKDLAACEIYLFAVGVYGDYGAGPLGRPSQVPTDYSKRAAPKNVRVFPSGRNYEIFVTWSSSCDRIDEPVAYTVMIHRYQF